MDVFTELPLEYQVAYVFDMKEKKTGIVFNIAAAIIMIAAFLLTFVLKMHGSAEQSFQFSSTAVFIFSVGMILYIVLHELVHGLFYKIFTKKKLTFGFSASCAFCGVPEVYVKRNKMVMTALAPTVIFTIFFLGLICSLPMSSFVIVLIALFSIHLGGCIGDIYISLLLMIKYDADTLINDTGAKQTICVKR